MRDTTAAYTAMELCTLQRWWSRRRSEDDYLIIVTSKLGSHIYAWKHNYSCLANFSAIMKLHKWGEIQVETCTHMWKFEWSHFPLSNQTVSSVWLPITDLCNPVVQLAVFVSFCLKVHIDTSTELRHCSEEPMKRCNICSVFPVWEECIWFPVPLDHHYERINAKEQEVVVPPCYEPIHWLRHLHLPVLLQSYLCPHHSLPCHRNCPSCHTVTHVMSHPTHRSP